MQARGLLNYRLTYCWPKVTSPAYVNQTSLNGKLGKNWGPSKNLGGHGPPSPPLESPLVVRELQRGAYVVP